MRVEAAGQIHASEGVVLSEAVARIASFWKLTNAEIGRVLGISGPTASRLRSGSYRLERGLKPFELAQFLVRLFRGLDATMGSDDAAAARWLRTANEDLGGRPVDLIQTVRGLTDVADYVDDFRARV
jgi:uncharacterized protein (DUF2384 family)